MKLLCDYSCNRGRPQIQVLLLIFRVAQMSRRSRTNLARLLSPLASAAYRLPALFLYGIDIPVSTSIGPRLSIHHGIGLVVNADSKIGSDVVLRQGVTIGNKSGSLSPTIGDGVDIGASALVIGPINVGAGAVIGAGAVVVKDVASSSVVVGNPARALVDASSEA